SLHPLTQGKSLCSALRSTPGGPPFWLRDSWSGRIMPASRETSFSRGPAARRGQLALRTNHSWHRRAHAVPLAGSAGGRVDLVADVVERVAGVGAEGADRRDADHDDQGQHDRVLDRRRAVVTLQEVHHRILELTHWIDASWFWKLLPGCLCLSSLLSL